MGDQDPEHLGLCLVTDCHQGLGRIGGDQIAPVRKSRRDGPAWRGEDAWRRSPRTETGQRIGGCGADTGNRVLEPIRQHRNDRRGLIAEGGQQGRDRRADARIGVGGANFSEARAGALRASAFLAEVGT